MQRWKRIFCPSLNHVLNHGGWVLPNKKLLFASEKPANKHKCIIFLKEHLCLKANWKQWSRWSVQQVTLAWWRPMSSVCFRHQALPYDLEAEFCLSGQERMFWRREKCIKVYLSTFYHSFGMPDLQIYIKTDFGVFVAYGSPFTEH